MKKFNIRAKFSLSLKKKNLFSYKILLTFQIKETYYTNFHGVFSYDFFTKKREKIQRNKIMA